MSGNRKSGGGTLPVRVARFIANHKRLPIRSDQWPFSHDGINETATFRWWSSLKASSKERITQHAVPGNARIGMTDEQEHQLVEWIGEPWKEWKSNETIVIAILRYKELQGDAWGGTVSESFVVPREGEEGCEDWHESMWGIELGQIARDLSYRDSVVVDLRARLKAAGFLFIKALPIREIVRLSVAAEEQWNIHYRALLDYLDNHEGKWPTTHEKYTFEGKLLSLGNWVLDKVLRCRGIKDRKGLRDDQRRLLEKIGGFRQCVDNPYQRLKNELVNDELNSMLERR